MTSYDILWRIHAVLMSISFAALSSGIVISRFYFKKKWRYKIHKKLGITAGITGVTGLLLAFTIVQISSGAHLTSPHTILGAVTGLLLILTPLAGLQIRKTKKKKQMKLSHRTMGYITLVLIIFTILSGLLFTGILRLPISKSGTVVSAKTVVSSGQGEQQSVSSSSFSENQIEVAGILFSWRIENGYLEGELKSPGKGWVAVGFNPENLMQGADFVIGYVEDGNVYVRDDYGSWYTSHDSDISMNGSEDIEVLGGGEDESGTTVQFRKPLSSEDANDHTFTIGEEIPVIFAYSNEDSFTGMHLKKGKTKIRF
ncbi:MAG: hypothetical protein DRP60_05175 [Spirochaetes bacterium]|nr:MAG: hypothetical protein DRP60_05175 [Spirochaetota bacterium]